MAERTTSTFLELIHRGVLEIGDGYRAKNSELDGDGLPFMRAGNLTDQGWKTDGLERFHRHLADKISGKVSRHGDTVITTKGNSTGRTGYVAPGMVPFVYSPHLSFWRTLDPCQIDARYLRYWAIGPEMADQLASMAHGTDMAPYLSLSDQKRLRISLPEISQQRAIGAILGALDDKIAVNERLAAAVDDLAAALFEDLLTADAEGTEVLLGDIADVNVRTVKAQDSGSLRYVDISSVGVGSYGWPEEMPWRDAPGRARRKAAVGDTIWSTVRPNRRSHALVLDEDPDLVFSTGLAVLSPKAVGPAFLYESTRLASFQVYLESVAEGSAYPAVRADRFKGAPIILPSEDARFRFEETVMAMRLRAHQAHVESRTLAALRDTLLPQLMSGRLRVKDAEKIGEDQV
ncbi:restriction endonuclease subunit S [Streptomyces sp. CA-181903]|uniref:restriction endonuclease subunit S n=1 Tax=Streptomyces sp. CA-181903 TaxID=3240055 RepID=UPI003D947989